MREQSNAHLLSEQGVKPTRFYINSEGDYGHSWPGDQQDTYGDPFEQMGKPSSPAEAERNDERAFWREAIDPRENILWRLHRHVSTLGSDLWRFYAGIDYTKNPAHITLSLAIEYILDDAEFERLSEIARTGRWLASPGVMHEDWENPARSQCEVWFDVRDMGKAQIADLQLRWLTATIDEPWGRNFVSVL